MFGQQRANHATMNKIEKIKYEHEYKRMPKRDKKNAYNFQIHIRFISNEVFYGKWVENGKK